MSESRIPPVVYSAQTMRFGTLNAHIGAVSIVESGKPRESLLWVRFRNYYSLNNKHSTSLYSNAANLSHVVELINLFDTQRTRTLCRHSIVLR